MKRIVFKILIFLKREKDKASQRINNHLCSLQCQRKPSSYFSRSARVVNLQGEPSRIEIGSSTHIMGELLVFRNGGQITVGDFCFIGEGTRIWSGADVAIGSHVFISHDVNIMDTNSHELDSKKRSESYLQALSKGYADDQDHVACKPVVIKNHAWIAFNSIILKGVTIGAGAIVAAGSVVTMDVPDYVIVAGNPAKAVGTTS
jgi:acetyltransferase-like isoleucine patch superfamily enzyme